MRVRFWLNVECSDGSTSFEKVTELPFAPRVGDFFVFCTTLCCEWGELIGPDDRLVYVFEEGGWLAEIDSDGWGQYSVEHVVEHFLSCGFEEVDGCREMNDAAHVRREDV